MEHNEKSINLRKKCFNKDKPHHELAQNYMLNAWIYTKLKRTADAKQSCQDAEDLLNKRFEGMAGYEIFQVKLYQIH